MKELKELVKETSRWMKRHNTAEAATDTNGLTQKVLILGSGARAIKGSI